MKFLPSYLVIIYASCTIGNLAIGAIIAGSNGTTRSSIDLYAINYDGVGSKVYITPIEKSLPATILDLKQGLFIYINEEKICFAMAFASKSQWEGPISDINLKLPMILEEVFGAEELFYATKQLAIDDEDGTLREDLRKGCNANQIWWLSNTKPNLPTAEEFMQSRGKKIVAKENAGEQLSKDSVSQNEVRRIRRDAELDGNYLRKKSRKLITPEKRKKQTSRRRMRKLKPSSNIQNDDHLEGGVIIEGDIPYISPSFSRQDETGTFRHYLGFNDELEQDSYKTYHKVLPLPDDSQPLTNKKSVNRENDDENESRSDTYTNKGASEFQFPKTIVKDGQVFYRHDLNQLESDDKETDNYISEANLPVVDNINTKTPFQTFASDVQRQHGGSNKIAQQGFNRLLDQMRQIGSHTPITSAAIASAAVKGNSKGSSSHVIGAAMNNGYFAAAARGHDSSGTLTQTLVQGSGRGSAGRATVVATKKKGNAFVQVDHSEGGSSISYSTTQNGETIASAEIDHRPNNAQEKKVEQSFGESESNIYDSYDDEKVDTVDSSEDQNINALGQILPGQIVKGSSMIDNIMEEVYESNINYPAYTHDVDSQKDTVFRENYSEDEKGNLITGYTIIDQGGLLVGAGDPPREGEIQQIHQGILPEGGLQLEEKTNLNPKIDHRSINIPLNKENLVSNDNEFENYSIEQVNLVPTSIDSEEADRPINSHDKFNYGSDIYTPSEENLHDSQAVVNLPFTLENGKTFNPLKTLDKKSTFDHSLQQLEDYHQSAHSFPSHLDVDYIDANQVNLQNKLISSSSYQGQQNFPTKLSNEITATKINSEDVGAEIHETFLPYSPIESYAIPEPEPLPISPLAPKNYSAHLKKAILKNIESPETTTHAVYDYDTSYYPDYYEPNNKSNPLDENLYPVKSSYSDGNQQIPHRNLDDNKNQAVTMYDKDIISDLMDKTIPPISKQKMVTPSTLVLPIIFPENNMIENNDLLQPGEAGSMQTIEPVGPGEPKIKILTLENNDRARELYQREGAPIEPGEKIPGTSGYRVPPGFRGRVIFGHSHPIEVASKRAVKGYNTKVNFQPEKPQTGNVFASISGAPTPSQLQGNKTGVHITLSSHSASRNRPRSLNPLPRSPVTNYSRSSHQLVGPATTKRPWRSGNYNDRTRDKTYSNKERYSKSTRTGHKNNECGYYSNNCNKMQGPYQGATICMPIFIEVACCC